MSEVKRVIIHTDGACSGNPGPGGWGAVLRYGAHEKELSGFAPDTTNNRMELSAVIAALNSLKRAVPVEVVTDSVYVRDGISKWLPGWRAKGWKTAAKKPVKNQDLWQELAALNDRFDVTWTWIKGHAGHELNERADELARRAIQAARASGAAEPTD